MQIKQKINFKCFTLNNFKLIDCPIKIVNNIYLYDKNKIKLGIQDQKILSKKKKKKE